MTSFLHFLERAFPLPERFDENEWFILINIVIGFTLVALCPRRYPIVISILLVLFIDSVALIFDHTIGQPPLDLYDVNDKKKYELTDDFTYIMYAPYGLLSAYLYDKFKPKGFLFTAYIIGWSLLSVGFEWIAVKFHVFTYNNWNLLYSFSVYIVATALYIWFYQFLMRYLNRSQEKAASVSK